MTQPVPAPTPDAAKERERILARRANRDGGKSSSPASAEESGGGILHHLRGWADALVFAFLLAMFIRTYVFELFMIPTGSMTPNLIGDDMRSVSEFDWDKDGQQDIVVALPGQPLHVHLRNKQGQFERLLLVNGVNTSTEMQFKNPRVDFPGRGRRDMIMVNKFAYWFTPPERGDIVVFKVPDHPRWRFDPNKPVYIKRAAGLPGETITLQPPQPFNWLAPGAPGRVTPDNFGGVEAELVANPILVNGKPVTMEPYPRLHPMPRLLDNEPFPAVQDQVIEVPDDGVLMCGDNSLSSLDSRYWGPVPLSHLRGKAVLRYWPARTFKLLEHGGE